MQALYAAKRFIEDGLCRELNLMRVEVPLIVDAESGVNDYLDRDGSRTPIEFHIANDSGAHPIDAQVVQAATKWKRMALKQFGCKVGEGLCTDMRAVRKDYFLDHDHSAYVDQWDWEKAITPDERNLDYLKQTVRTIWKVMTAPSSSPRRCSPTLKVRGRTSPTSSRSSTPRRSSTRTPTCRASSARPRSSRSTRRSSSSASAGR